MSYGETKLFVVVLGLLLFLKPSGQISRGTDLVVALRMGENSVIASDSFIRRRYECLSLSRTVQFTQSILCLVSLICR